MRRSQFRVERESPHTNTGDWLVKRGGTILSRWPFRYEARAELKRLREHWRDQPEGDDCAP